MSRKHELKKKIDILEKLLKFKMKELQEAKAEALAAGEPKSIMSANYPLGSKWGERSWQVDKIKNELGQAKSDYNKM